MGRRSASVSQAVSAASIADMLDAMPAPKSKRERVQDALKPLRDAMVRNIDRGVPIKDIATLLTRQLAMPVTAVDVGVAVERRKYPTPGARSGKAKP